MTRVHARPPKLLIQSFGGLLPSRSLAVAEDEARALGRARRGGKGLLEPGVRVGEVVRNDVEQDAETEVVGLADHRLGLGDGAEQRLDRAEVRDVVAPVLHRGRVPRGDPQRIDAEVGEVAQARPQALDIADAVSVAVGEAADVDLVDDGAPPPRPAVAADSDLRHARAIASGAAVDLVMPFLLPLARRAAQAPFGHRERY